MPNQIFLKQCCTALLMVSLTACSLPNKKQIDYQRNVESSVPPLAIPPVISKDMLNRKQVNKPNEVVVLSTYNNPTTHIESVKKNVEDVVLPDTKEKGIALHQAGNQNWLSITNQSSETVFNKARAFWLQEGFILTQDNLNQGLIETDWQDYYPKINQDLIRSGLSKVFKNAYVEKSKRKFQTRIEPGPNKTLLLFVHAEELADTVSGTNNEFSKWQSDKEYNNLNIIYLKKMQLALAGYTNSHKNSLLQGNINDQQANSQQAAQSGLLNNQKQNQKEENIENQKLETAIDQTKPEQINAYSPVQNYSLTINSDYDNTWQAIEYALDNGHFTVEQAQNETGLITIRYVDPAESNQKKQSFWNQIRNGKKEMTTKEYRIQITALTPNVTEVSMRDANNNKIETKLAESILLQIYNALNPR